MIVDDDISESRESVDFQFSGQSFDNRVVVRVEIVDDDDTENEISTVSSGGMKISFESI